MLELVHIDYGFGENDFALKDVSFKLARGEKVCLLGPNGSGKSTLLKIAAGVLTPHAGDVRVDGAIRNTEPENNQARGMVGFIFQNPDDQILTGSVETELAFVLENLRFDRVEMEMRIREQANKFALQNLLKRHPATLSAGEKQRVALASTFISQPQILILDEPTSYLDDIGKDLLRSTVFSSRDWSVLAATQHIEELRDYDRVLYLDNGVIEFNGGVSEFKLSSWYSEIKDCRHSNSSEAVTAEQRSRAISVRGIEFAYPNEAVCLSALDAHFPAGKVTTIGGASGSGKSTLALLVAGLLKPSRGEVLVGSAATTESERLQRVGMIFQLPESAIFADTVFEEVAFGLRNQGVKEPELAALVDRALTAVDLEPSLFLQRNPFTLSAGEQRLIGIASILALDREILIFDESTAGLDWRHTKRVLELVRRLKEAGKTIILVSHDSAFREQVADTVIEL